MTIVRDAKQAEQSERKPGTAWWVDMREFILRAPRAHPSRLPPLRTWAKGRALYPYPKCDATLSDGSRLKLSCWVDAKKPDAGEALRALHAISDARGLVVIECTLTGMPELAARKKDSPAQKLKAIVGALKSGQIEIALRLAEAA